MICTKCNGTGEMHGREHEMLCDECFGNGTAPHNIAEITKLTQQTMALQNAIELLIANGYDATASVLIEIRDEKKQALSDAKIDAESLPFPEK